MKEKIAATIAVLVLISLWVGVALLYKDTAAFLETAIKTEGTVISFKTESHTESINTNGHHTTKTRYTYCPVIQFQLQNGDTTAFISNACSKPPSYKQGQQVDVLYNPQAPDETRIDAFWELWGLCTIMGIIGGIPCLIIIAYLIRRSIARCDKKDLNILCNNFRRHKNQ